MISVKNTIQLIGHLGKDVEIKEFDSGSSKVNFSLATNDYYKNSKGEKVEDTHWHNIVAWGKLAENMNKFLAKGSEVLIKGKLVPRSYTDKEGITKYITEIVAHDFLMFGKKSEPF